MIRGTEKGLETGKEEARGKMRADPQGLQHQAILPTHRVQKGQLSSSESAQFY